MPEDMDGLYLIQDKAQKEVLFNTVMNLRFP
jgi:hypothetical protein